MFQFVKAWKERRAQEKLHKLSRKRESKRNRVRENMSAMQPIEYERVPDIPTLTEPARKDVPWPWEGK